MARLFPLLVLSLFFPIAGVTEEWVPLYNRVDPVLQASLDKRLRQTPEWSGLIARKKMAVCVVDMSGAPRFARVNGNQMMYAASLPKIAILLSVYASFEDGSLPETEQHHQDLADMIRISSNSAASRLIDAVGLEKIQQVMKGEYGLYDEKRGGGLWVGKRYARSGPRVGDPINNISHGATATQVCRFFYLLATEKLISAERSRLILGDLSDPRLHHKFVSQVEERAPKARMFRKSGTWRDWHSDAIMVRGELWRNYILVGIVESPNGESILRRLLPAVEELIVPLEYAEGIGRL